MSAAEHTILSADDYVQEMLRAAEAQFDDMGPVAALNRRAFLKLVGIAGGSLNACGSSLMNTRNRARPRGRWQFREIRASFPRLLRLHD